MPRKVSAVLLSYAQGMNPNQHVLSYTKDGTPVQEQFPDPTAAKIRADELLKQNLSVTTTDPAGLITEQHPLGTTPQKPADGLTPSPFSQPQQKAAQLNNSFLSKIQWNHAGPTNVTLLIHPQDDNPSLFSVSMTCERFQRDYGQSQHNTVDIDRELSMEAAVAKAEEAKRSIEGEAQKLGKQVLVGVSSVGIED